MSEVSEYRRIRDELETLVTRERASLSQILAAGDDVGYFLLPQGGVLEHIRFGRFGLYQGSEEALIRIYDLSGRCIATYTKGLEPWHVFAMRLPSPFFKGELNRLKSRPSFLDKPNSAPSSLIEEKLLT